MRRRQKRARSERCAHPATLTVTSAGLDCMVCESCGRVNVRYRSGLTGMIDRKMFARPADESSSLNPSMPNALVKNLTSVRG